MSDFDMGSGSSGMMDSSKRAQLMDQVKSQIAVAAAQELLQKMSDKCFKKCIYKPGTSLDNSEQGKLPAWTSRGQGICPQCGLSYSTAWKPKTCKGCAYEIGGSYVPKEKKKKTTSSPDGAIIIACSTDSKVKIISTKKSYRDNRVFVVADSNSFVCHHEKCKEALSVYMASRSTDPFSCPHVELARNPSPPLHQSILSQEHINTYACDNTTKSFLRNINPPENFHHIVHLSSSCYAVYTQPSTSSPTGYTHILQQPDQSWHCLSKSCNRKTGSAKQLKTKPICSHLHLIFCYLQLSSVSTNCLTSSSESSSTNQESNEISVCRQSTIKLNQNRSILYPVPTASLLTCQSMSNNWPSTFCPDETVCSLCNATLSSPRLHPGQSRNDISFIITPSCIFKQVEIKVKLCQNPDCRAMYQVWPIKQGLFNICDKILLAMEILVHWRELFKRGVPITIAIESSLQVWIQISQVQLDENQQKYLSSLLYNGFYGFEMLSERSLDDVVCGICGVIGQVYYGDGNEKNCCSIDEVSYSTENDDLEDTPTSLEDFLSNLKTLCLERITFSSSKQLSKVQASKVPSIIAPSLRGPVTYNTEFKKKSVYLNNKLLKKDEINGDPLLLFEKLQDLNINMSTLESMTESELKGLCDYCKVENSASLSKSLMVSRLHSLYASLVTGSSACHGFTQVPGNTGGFYHMVCRHGTTVASKFLMLQESVRDAADLYLSLKYPPPLFVLDTPCGFSRHVNIRMPDLAAKYWGENLGCFEKPSLVVQPSQVSVPGIVTSEFGVSRVDVHSLNLSTDADPSLHPITGSSRRYVVGDRFHTSSNPHKSPLCNFHDINLCTQKDAIKTSYQECQNNSKNVKRLRSSTMQSFPIHFMYNFLMDYYHNEAIVQKQRENLKAYLKDNQLVTRDMYQRFVIESVGNALL